MKKPYHYTELSQRKCKYCKKPIKKNVLVRQPDADECMTCSNISKGKKTTFMTKNKGTKKEHVIQQNQVEKQKKNKLKYAS